MRNLLHFAARMYPRTWRERYSEEFAAFLEDLRPHWKDVFDILRGGIKMQLARVNPITILAASVLLGGLAAAGFWYTAPTKWRSEAVVSVRPSDVQRLPTDAVAEMSKRAFSNSQVAGVIAGYDLYPAERASRPMADIIKLARKDIMIRFKGADPDIFLVSFTYPDPRVAQIVVNNLLKLLVEENFQFASVSRIEIRRPPNLPSAPIGPGWLAYRSWRR